MTKVLEAIATKMAALNIEYHYMINNKSTVTYPYVTGEFGETGYSFEDGSTTGTLLLECWSRTSNASLITISETIKTNFNNLHGVNGTVAYYISYANTIPVRTYEEGLYKVQIYLDVKYWEGA